MDGAIQVSRLGSRHDIDDTPGASPAGPPALDPTAQHSAEQQRDRAGDRYREQRVPIAAELVALEPDDAADQRGADELPDAQEQGQQALAGAAALVAGLLQRDVAQRRAEQRRQPEPDRRACCVEASPC